MLGPMTIFAVLPSAGSVPALMAARQALAAGGKLVGLMVIPAVVPNLPPAETILPSFIDAQVEANRRQVQTAEDAFKQACDRAGVACEWRTTVLPSNYVSGPAGCMARAADLIIAPKGADEEVIGQHDVDQLVFESGRPVLTLPAGWSGSTLGGRVLVGWNGKREAARAVFDALPLLKQARHVQLLSVRESSHESLTPAEQIADTLARHGVPVDAVSLDGGRPGVAAAIRAHALETGADLLVMGCYGHSRLREMILGGVTRDMLRDPPLPLLLSS